MSTFWNTIAEYNAATWPVQLLLIILAIVVPVLLVVFPSRSSTIVAKIYIMVLHAWISVAYYAIYCEARSYSNVLGIYWGILSLAWIKDLLQNDTRFALRNKNRLFGVFVILLPLVYPFASIMRGLSFPHITTPVMPCTVAIYTIGLLLLFASRVNIFIVLLLLNWAMIGVTKTWYFGIPEDIILVLTSIPALYIFFREYFALDQQIGTKPGAGYIKALLLLVSLGVCVALCWVLFVQIKLDQF